MAEDIRNFKAPYLPYDKIRNYANKFLDTYWEPKKLPIDIENIIEFKLNIEITPIPLRSAFEVDSWLSNDLKTICIDLELFERYERRYRYSLAHEVGHYYLHQDIYKDLKFEKIEEWKDLLEKISPNQYGFCEKHAYDFAGLILVPDGFIENSFNRALTRVEEQGFSVTDFDKEILLEFMLPTISEDFNVSNNVIRKRIKYNDLSPY